MQQLSTTLKYRPEIDGLRAIAVTAVVLYHAEFVLLGTKLFKGGFIGVDIFFVISGYLITSIIIRELREHRFSLANFYERRARRILPALYVVMFASIPFAWLYMLPKAMKEYAGSVLSALAFGSNIWFWKNDSYWAEPSALKPFLHTWTLAVEEQFYLLYPIALILLWKISRKHLLLIFVLGFLVSLLLADYGSVKNAEATFYLLPTRGWELLAGSILAQLEISKGRIQHPLLGHFMPALGLILICYAILYFDAQMQHPSLITLLPVIGTLLIIWFGYKSELVSDLLGSKPFVAVGLISYSFYLWHFPVFSFARMNNQQPSFYDKAEWIFLSIILSVFSYFLIEKPARNKTLFSRRSLLITLSASMTILISSFTYIYMTDGARFRLQDFSSIIDTAYWNKDKGHRELFSTHSGCWLELDTIDSNDPFKVCKSAENLKSQGLIMVVGDSHVAGLIPGLIEHFGRDSIVQRVLNGCRPYINYDDYAKYGGYKTEEKKEFCIRGFKAVFAEIEKLQPSLIIFGGNYKQPEETIFYIEQFSNQLEIYKHKTLIMGPLPKGNSVKTLFELYKQDPLNFKMPEQIAPWEITYPLENAFKAAAEKLDIKYLSPVATFCNREECLVRVSHERDAIVSFDRAHITHKASGYLINRNFDLINGFLKKDKNRAK